MKIIVSLFGEPKDKNILYLVQMYQERIGRFEKIEFLYFKKYEGFEKFSEQVVAPGRVVYFMAEKGALLDTKTFAEKVYIKNLNEGVKEILFTIGPAEGWRADNESDMLRKSLSLSPLTMQHDLAFLVLVEQIYRAVSIKNNLPYHK